MTSFPGRNSVPNPVHNSVAEKFRHSFPFPLTMSSLALGLAGALAIIISVVSAPKGQGLTGASLAIIMLGIAVVDRRSFRIPDSLTATGFVFGLVHAGLSDSETIFLAVSEAALRGVVLALLLLSFRQLYAYVRGRQGLGMGDVKLAGVAGVWLNWIMLPIVMEIAAVAGLTTYLIRQWILRQPVEAKSRIPFGLFFAPAIWICWLLEARALVF